jgi:hypothetical protein
MFRRYLCTELLGKDKDMNVNCEIRLKVFIAVSVNLKCGAGGEWKRSVGLIM